MRFKIVPFLFLLSFVFSSFSGYGQCSGNYEIDFQVDPINCSSEEIILTLNFLQNNEDSIKVFAFGSLIQLQNIAAGPTFEVYQIPENIDTLTIIGYPSLCETTWLKAEWGGTFSAGFEIVDTSSCIYSNGHILTVNPSGGWTFPQASYTISLIEPNGMISIGDSFNVGSGLYLAEFEDEYGCIHIDSLEIDQGLSIVSSFTVNTTDSNCEASNGTASINFINMSPPFAYNWMYEDGTSFSFQAEVQDLGPGKYYIEIFDNICGSIDSFYIDENINFELNAPQNPCQPDLNTASVNVLDTNGPYFITWYDENGVIIGNEDSIQITSSGNFSVAVTNNICTTTEDFSIGSPIQVEINGDLFVCNNSSTCVEIIPVGGIPPYLYTWSIPTAPPVSSFCELYAGTYTVTITDVNACIAVVNFTIQESDLDDLQIDSYPTSCVGAGDGILSATISNPNYTYNWSNFVTTPHLDGLTAGTYSLTVTDPLGCLITNVAIVEDGTMVNDIVTNCASVGSLGSIVLDVNNPFANNTYSWSNGVISSEPELLNLDIGIYSVTVTNESGTCQEEYANIFICDASQSIINDAQICKGDSVEINIVNPFGWTFISWVNPDFNNIDCDDCYDIRVSPDTNTTYEAAFSGPNNEIFIEEYNVAVYNDCVWPGDVDTNLIVDHFDLLPLALTLDENGPSRTEMDIDFYGHLADDWPDSIQGYSGNQKHADCDGDGVVTYADTMAIIQNWGETYSRSGIVNQASDGIPIFLDTDTIPGTGISISLPLIIGTMDTMANDIYGLAFSIHFDPEVVVDGSARLAPIDSWMSDGIDQYIMVQKEFSTVGRLDVAISRTNSMNASGFGQVADFIIIMEDDILRNRGADLEVEFEIANVEMINYQGEVISTRPKTSEVIIIDRSLGTNDPNLSHMVQLYPNPSSRRTSVQVETTLNLENFELLSLQGKILMQGNMKGRSEKMISLDVEPGVYFFKSITNEGQHIVKKLIIQ